MYKRNYVRNQYPKFIPYKNISKKKLLIIEKVINKIKKNNFLNKNILPINKNNGKILNRTRCLNKHRIRAIQAVITAIVYYLEQNAKFVNLSVEKIADECGLSTTSKSGKKSISRVSRLISNFMEPMGLLKINKEKKKSISKIISKKIIITPLFFTYFEISNKKLKENNLSKKNKIKKENIKKREKEIISFIDEKKAKKKILYSIINRYSTEELSNFGSNGLKKMVDTEYLNLNKTKKILNLNTEE